MEPSQRSVVIENDATVLGVSFEIHEPICTDKYVRSEIETPYETKKTLYLENEKHRRRNFFRNGLKDLVKTTPYGNSERTCGQSTITVRFPRCPIYCEVNSSAGSLYSLHLVEEGRGKDVRLEFRHSELFLIIEALSRLLPINIEEPEMGIDVPVWGGRDLIRICVVIKKRPNGDFEFIGLALTQVNLSESRRRVRSVGFSEKTIPVIPVEGLRVSSTNVRSFMYLLQRANESINLHWEIAAQQYATFKMAAKRTRLNPSYTKEDYYWYVIEAFYSLEVKWRDQIPAYYVLGDFLKGYLCEDYCIYYSGTCDCERCSLHPQNRMVDF